MYDAVGVRSYTHPPVFYWVGWGPDGWILGLLLQLTDKDVNRLLRLKALEGSHDAFHLLIFLSQFLLELLKHRMKESNNDSQSICPDKLQLMCRKKPQRV